MANDKVLVIICRTCRKVKRFEQWVEQSDILKEEIAAGRISVQLDTCDECLKKVTRPRNAFA